MKDSNFTRKKFPPQREIVVDAGYLASGRHIIYALLEVDVTDARIGLEELSISVGRRMSFTAFIVASFARAVVENPSVHGFLDWRRRLVTFHDVDVVTMIEPRAGAVAIPHIIRDANHKTIIQISDEIRAVQTYPGSSAQAGRLVDLAPKLPRFVRLLYFRILKLNPTWFKNTAGTVVVTSVGMFGTGGGWGIGFLPTHNLGVTVGGISNKPGVKDGEIQIREFLNLTLSFDHDIIDGAPAARFSNCFAELIESGEVVDIKLAESNQGD
jgi:pyruvate/2-oxoglutarate dehydrogenase complex dihydrolipoamide acyltransferase (E2) component